MSSTALHKVVLFAVLFALKEKTVIDVERAETMFGIQKMHSIKVHSKALPYL